MMLNYGKLCGKTFVIIINYNGDMLKGGKQNFIEVFDKV